MLAPTCLIVESLSVLMTLKSQERIKNQWLLYMAKRPPGPFKARWADLSAKTEAVTFYRGRAGGVMRTRGSAGGRACVARRLRKPTSTPDMPKGPRMPESPRNPEAARPPLPHQPHLPCGHMPRCSLLLGPIGHVANSKDPVEAVMVWRAFGLGRGQIRTKQIARFASW